MPLQQLMSELLRHQPALDAPHSESEHTTLHTHTARCMCGAWTSSQSSAALRALGFHTSDAVGRAAMLELRLMCLDSVTAYYQRRKETLIH
jgi:hypothetical protein